MSHKLRTRITSGLTGEVLREAASHFDGLSESDPIVSFAVGRVLHELADEYDDQPIEDARYRAVDGALRAPLLAILDADTTTVRFAALETFLRSYAKL
jgi:hypothetical protein